MRGLVSELRLFCTRRCSRWSASVSSAARGGSKHRGTPHPRSPAMRSPAAFFTLESHCEPERSFRRARYLAEHPARGRERHLRFIRPTPLPAKQLRWRRVMLVMSNIIALEVLVCSLYGATFDEQCYCVLQSFY